MDPRHGHSAPTIGDDHLAPADATATVGEATIENRAAVATRTRS